LEQEVAVFLPDRCTLSTEEIMGRDYLGVLEIPMLPLNCLKCGHKLCVLVEKK